MPRSALIQSGIGEKREQSIAPALRESPEGKTTGKRIKGFRFFLLSFHSFRDYGRRQIFENKTVLRAIHMEQLSQGEFTMDRWRVSPGRGVISDGDLAVRLEPLVMDVLVYFARHPGKVVTREELEEQVWRGALVSYDAVTATVIKLRKALGDDARKPRYLATIPKRGYQLIAPVRQLAEQGFDTVLAPARSGQPPGSLPRRPWQSWLGAAAIAALLVWMVLPWQLAQRLPEPVADGYQSSIIVMPFENLSNHPEQDFLSTGIADDLITDLSKLESVRVIARQTSQYFSQNPASLSELARELDVDYIVQGSLQQSAERVRINVQLIRIDTEESVWAERFDAGADELFKVQDEITRQVMTAIAGTVSSPAPEVSPRSARSFEAYNAFLLGQQHIRTRSRQGYELAMAEFQRAIEIDPAYGRAYGAMAFAVTQGYRYHWSDLSLVEARERALELALKAMTLDPASPQVHWSVAFVHVHRQEYDAAEKAARQSITLSPNYADGHALLAYIANWRNRPQDAITHIQKASELNPYHTFEYSSILGLAFYSLGQYQQAVDTLRKSLERNESALNPRLLFIAACVRLGLMEQAAWEVEFVTLNRPDATLGNLYSMFPFEHEARLLALKEDLRKAGLPE